MSGASEQRLCTRTGLALRRARRQISFRIAQHAYGPLNPIQRAILRPSYDAGWLSWQRWDVPGHRTIYQAEDRRIAFQEVLSWHKRKLADGLPFDLNTYLDDVGPGDPGAWQTVEREWRQRNHMGLNDLPANWRQDRMIYELTLPDSGWYVDINDGRTFAAIENALGPQLYLLGGIKEIDLAVLAGMRRDITCTVAEWIFAQSLDDGTNPHGIVYPGRTGGGECYATWLRATDDGANTSTEPTTVTGENPIAANDPDLLDVQRAYGIRIH